MNHAAPSALSSGESESAARAWDQRLVLHALRTAEEYEAPQVVSAEGCWLTLEDGRRVLDLHGQYMSAGIGHGDPHVRAALHAAIDGVDFVCESFSHSRKGYAAKLLLEQTMEGSDWAGGVRFACTGSEAAELALLMARVYMDRPLIVTEQGAYHGWTPGANAATSIPYLRNVYTNPSSGDIRSPRGLPPDPVAPAPICLHCGPGGTCDRCRLPDGTLTYVLETERMIRSLGVDRVAGFITELYHGAAGFMVPDGYPQQVRAMADRLGILWIDDEVIAGAGRTGKWWAYQHYGVTPDLLITAKGISSSAAPAGAVVASKAIADFFRNGRWNVASTLSGHPLSVAAVAANIEVMVRDRIVEHAARTGEHLHTRLKELAGKHPSIRRISGKGLAWAIELAKPGGTGERWIPADRWLNVRLDGEPALWPVELVATECLKRGVWILSFVPNAITLSPPLRITEAEINVGIDALDEALDALDALGNAAPARPVTSQLGTASDPEEIQPLNQEGTLSVDNLTALAGRKALILTADKFEDAELLYPLYRLGEEGVAVTVAGLDDQPLTGYKGHGPVTVDTTAGQVAADDFDALVIPGGFAPDKLRRSEAVLALVRAFDAAGKPIAFICHAGWVPISAKIINGRTATSLAAIRDDMVNAGADWVDEATVVDGNLISARTPADLGPWMKALLAALEKAGGSQ